MTEIIPKEGTKQLAIVVHVLQKSRIWSFHIVVLWRKAMECPKIYNAVDSYCSAHITTFGFGDAVVVYCALLKLPIISMNVK